MTPSPDDPVPGSSPEPAHITDDGAPQHAQVDIGGHLIQRRTLLAGAAGIGAIGIGAAIAAIFGGGGTTPVADPSAGPTTSRTDQPTRHDYSTDVGQPHLDLGSADHGRDHDRRFDIELATADYEPAADNQQCATADRRPATATASAAASAATTAATTTPTDGPARIGRQRLRPRGLRDSLHHRGGEEGQADASRCVQDPRFRPVDAAQLPPGRAGRRPSDERRGDDRRDVGRDVHRRELHLLVRSARGFHGRHVHGHLIHCLPGQTDLNDQRRVRRRTDIGHVAGEPLRRSRRY